MEIKRRCVVNGQVRVQAFRTGLIYSGHVASGNSKNSLGRLQLLRVIRAP